MAAGIIVIIVLITTALVAGSLLARRRQAQQARMLQGEVVSANLGLVTIVSPAQRS